MDDVEIVQKSTSSSGPMPAKASRRNSWAGSAPSRSHSTSAGISCGSDGRDAPQGKTQVTRRCARKGSSRGISNDLWVSQSTRMLL